MHASNIFQTLYYVYVPVSLLIRGKWKNTCIYRYIHVREGHRAGVKIFSRVCEINDDGKVAETKQRKKKKSQHLFLLVWCAIKKKRRRIKPSV